ncbi:hypothetical protein SeMB42_g07096 [Synchytrium endobioticum]|uniref:Peroxin/Ferlin domain-containing protein n=1 Tax=Synchytrium endobioticum TaxID=286115 RepID=A0A507CFV5_9FUNG|nr:hypothetical protein SeMB42_g07096 [Synchytrium endobioticum]
MQQDRSALKNTPSLQKPAKGILTTNSAATGDLAPSRPSLQGNVDKPLDNPPHPNVKFQVARDVEKAPRLKGEVAERLYENQRGSALFGKPKFSARSLLPSDFPAWSDQRGAFRIEKEHENPPPGWEWKDPAWVLDLGGDVDAEGWSYAFSFRTKNWQGNPAPTTYVRRRLWCRTRKPVDHLHQNATSSIAPPALTFPPHSHQHVNSSANHVLATNRDRTAASGITVADTGFPPDPTVGDIYTRMSHTKSDRERLMVVRAIADSENVSKIPVDKLVAFFNHDYARLAALKLLLAHEPQDRLPVVLNKMVDLLPFYPSKLELVRHFHPNL